MLLAKVVEEYYNRQLHFVDQKCPDCGVYLKRVEYEEYGRCWLCAREVREDGRDSQ